jgi:hypothetical protein
MHREAMACSKLRAGTDDAQSGGEVRRNNGSRDALYEQLLREGATHPSRMRKRTLHRSHACPVRFESASFLFTDVEKSLLAMGCGGLVDTPCSMRWIL